MMKVLQINVLGKTGSTGRTTWEMHQHFTSHGVDSYIATAKGDECPESFAISSQKGIYVDIALSILSGLEGYHSRFQTSRLLRYMDKIRPDVVHLRNLHQSYINLNMLLRYLKKKDIATVITLHDAWFFTGKCCSPNLYDCQKWMAGCDHCPALKFDARKRFFDRTRKMWKDKKEGFGSIPRLAVIGNSKWTMENAKKSMLSSAKIVDYVYNWIDQTVFCPRNTEKLRQQYGLEGKKVILGVASFWSAKGGKGLDQYIALSHVMPSDWKIVLVGNLVAGAKLPENILHIPAVTDINQLAQWYSLADVYLNLSESETFGKAAAEALCCGTPLVAINRTANSELIPEGGGALLQTSEPSEIILALKEIFSQDKSVYTGICCQFSKERFDKETNIERYLSVYAQLLKS